MHVNGFPNSHLKHSQEGVPHVVNDFANSVMPIGIEGPLRQTNKVQNTMPESEKAKSDSKIHQKSEKSNFTSILAM